MQRRADLFRKAFAFNRHKIAQANGLYPYFKAIQSGAGPTVRIDGRELIMVGSNNYLGLTQHAKVKEAARQAIDRYGTGCTGSRFLNGTLTLHEEAERRLARFVRKEKALLMSTGFQTNLGTLSVLVARDDVILCDRMNHASIIDGCRLSFGRTIKYRHNDPADVERILNSVELEENPDTGVLIVTDGVFSMEGDLAPLPELVRLKHRYGARLMVDDAHGIGVLGATGRGTAEHFAVEAEVDLIMGTFSKSFGSLGGFIAGPAEVIEYIQHHARALIFSASMTPANVATVLAALDVMENDTEPRQRLWENTRRMQGGLRELGFNIGATQSPVIPVILGEFELVMVFWRALFDRGVFVNPIVPPAVPQEKALLRTSTMATHTPQMIDCVLDTFAQVGRELKVLT